MSETYFSLPEESQARNLVDELSNHYLDQTALTRHLLTATTQIVPASGPCSFIRLNRFMSERDSGRKSGRIFDTEHINQPDPRTVDNWLKLSNFFGNPIEQGIYQKFKPAGLEHGATHYRQIFPSESDDGAKAWRRTVKGIGLYLLAKKESVHSLAYFWVRCASDDLWFFSLRRKTHEKAFTDRDAVMLHSIASELYQQRQKWYCRRLRGFTPTERRVIGTMCGEDFNIEDSCEKLVMKPKTYTNHQENIYKRLREQGHPVRNRSSLLQYLRESNELA